MTELHNYVPELVQQCLSDSEEKYLTQIFERFGGYPTLEQMWALIDEPWVELGCDPLCMDDRVRTFYEHPVWLLNGLFIEQHAPSLKNRRVFSEWVCSQRPLRVADFGGGFGGLARFIGIALPTAVVEVIEPHPRAAAIALAVSTPNVRFVPALTGDYDLLIATDVFEHVPDPIGLAAETAAYLRISGVYLIANCFQPVIKCHLSQIFHLNIAWDRAMKAMGLDPEEKVGYGRAYRRVDTQLNIAAARKVGDCAKRLYPWVRHLPRGQTKIGDLLMRGFCS
jgi:hypothetical protein